MSGRPSHQLSPHGTPARARWHYRQGHKPLRKHCVPCADANMMYYRFWKKGRRKRQENTLYTAL